MYISVMPGCSSTTAVSEGLRCVRPIPRRILTVDIRLSRRRFIKGVIFSGAAAASGTYIAGAQQLRPGAVLSRRPIRPIMPPD